MTTAEDLLTALAAVYAAGIVSLAECKVLRAPLAG
jgi:hypothetical protein